MDLGYLSSIEVVALTLYGEARGEPVDGQIAVGCIIRNRLHSGRYKTWSEVCFAPEQFSCWIKEKAILEEWAEKLIMGEIINDPIMRQCLYIAAGVINWDFTDNTYGCENYLTTELYKTNPPNWAKKLEVKQVIGNHTFLI